MKNLLSVLIIGIFLISLASADVYKQGQTIQLTAVCDNCTQVNITKIVSPDGTFTLLGQFPMTKNGTNYNYSYSNTQLIGNYHFTTCGDLNGVLTCEDTNNRDFEVNAIGLELSTARSIIHFGLLFLFLFMFILSLFVLGKLPSGEERGENGELLSINQMKYIRSILVFVSYLLVVVIMFISSNVATLYFGEELFGAILFKVFQILMALTLPIVVIWFIYLFYSAFREKELMKNMQRGIVE